MEQQNDDGRGWYHALVERLKEISIQRQELEALLTEASAVIAPPSGLTFLAQHEDTLPDDDIPDGFEACPIAASMLKEGHYCAL